jgi:hypothetical protein
MLISESHVAHIPWVHVTIGDISMPCHLQDHGLWEFPFSSTSKSVEGRSSEIMRVVDIRPSRIYHDFQIKEWKDKVSHNILKR